MLSLSNAYKKIIKYILFNENKIIFRNFVKFNQYFINMHFFYNVYNGSYPLDL